VVLVDGQPEQIKRAQRAARKAGVEVTIQLDIVKSARWLHYDRALADGLPIATVSSRARTATSCRTAWDAQAHAGHSPARRPCCACARCARAATSTTTGNFTSRRTTNGIAPVEHARKEPYPSDFEALRVRGGESRPHR
jgi:hypothetical protein